jgi:hypothetical protein
MDLTGNRDCVTNWDKLINICRKRKRETCRVAREELGLFTSSWHDVELMFGGGWLWLCSSSAVAHESHQPRVGQTLLFTGLSSSARDTP